MPIDVLFLFQVQGAGISIAVAGLDAVACRAFGWLFMLGSIVFKVWTEVGIEDLGEEQLDVVVDRERDILVHCAELAYKQFLANLEDAGALKPMQEMSESVIRQYFTEIDK